ncbi:unnamed protein product [Urochloa humidicola]
MDSCSPPGTGSSLALTHGVHGKLARVWGPVRRCCSRDPPPRDATPPDTGPCFFVQRQSTAASPSPWLAQPSSLVTDSRLSAHVQSGYGYDT